MVFNQTTSNQNKEEIKNMYIIIYFLFPRLMELGRVIGFRSFVETEGTLKG